MRSRSLYPFLGQVVPTVGLGVGLIMFTVGFARAVSKRSLNNEEVSHVFGLVLAVLSLLWVSASTMQSLSVTLRYISILFLLTSCGMLGSTIGINNYYSHYCHEDDVLASDANATVARLKAISCYDANIGLQYAGAAIAMFMLALHVVRIQELIRSDGDAVEQASDAIRLEEYIPADHSGDSSLLHTTMRSATGSTVSP